MKICSACFVEKPFTEFAFRSKERGTHQSKCKECARVYANDWYVLNRKHLCDKRRARYKESKV